MRSATLAFALAFVIAPSAHAQDGVSVRDGYAVETVVDGLTYATDVTFAPDGTMYVTEAGGHTYGTDPQEAPGPRIIRVTPDGRREALDVPVVAPEAVRRAEPTKYVTIDGRRVPSEYAIPEGIIAPLTGATWHDGLLYVASRSRYSTFDPETGEFRTIVDGLPSWGEFLNHKPVFRPDGMMYFVQSSQGQLGPVDAHFMRVITAWNKPMAREVPCEDVVLAGRNYTIGNGLTPQDDDSINVATYLPAGFVARAGQVVEGQLKCNGAMYRVRPDGRDLERVAWGLRSNFGYRWSPNGEQLVATQNSCNPIPPRETYRDWEPIYAIEEGAWYGWPDYCSSYPVTDDRFAVPLDDDFYKDYGKEEPEQLVFDLTEDTHRRLLDGDAAPPAPIAFLPVHSAAEGMVWGREDFGMDPNHEILVALFGNIVPFRRDEAPGFKVVEVDLRTNEVTDLLWNPRLAPSQNREGRRHPNLERPIQLEWGPDGALYVVDFGVINIDREGMHAVPNSGTVWRVTREE